MKRVFILLVCFALFSSLAVFAQTQEEKRRIEEKKREDLQPSEIQILRKKEEALPQISPLSLDYFTELLPKQVTFGYDACRLLVILMGVEDEYLNLDAQVAFLKERNLLPKKYQTEFNPMQPLRKGLAAYMFCKALGIKGGITLKLFGLSQRYCLKELAYEGIMPMGNVNDIVSGAELVSALTQSIDYMAKK